MPMRSSQLFCLSAAGFILAALPTDAKPLHKTSKPSPKPVAEKSVTIENSGSTNTTGFVITVSFSGSASCRVVGAVAAPDSLPKPRVQALSKDITSKLFTDLTAAGPLSLVPTRHGMRSVSFGTSTYVTYQGHRSPDLTFPANAQAQAIRDDIKTITQVMHAANNARFPLSRPMLP